MRLFVTIAIGCVVWGSILVKARSTAPLDDYLHPQFHAGPAKNWMNDPNGPVFFNGKYHLFFQYNPNGAVWGDMSWGHVVSDDLVHWRHLPVALYPDQPYDKGGVFSGSITILNDGTPAIAYTCVGNGQKQCLAFPSNISDPDLVEWHKDAANPVIDGPPPHGNPSDFRDDTTAWMLSNGDYAMAIGASITDSSTAKNAKNGAVWVYSSPDFHQWSVLSDHPLYTTDTLGDMYECPDFFPTREDPSVHVLKVSAQGLDQYLTGRYDETANSFLPISNATFRYDYGKFYASKSFLDSKTGRQILFGWVAEEDSNAAQRGWQGTQSLPRHLVYAPLPVPRLLSPPIAEMSLLRVGAPQTFDVSLKGTQTLPIAAECDQCEIQITFTVSEWTAHSSAFGVSVLRSPSAHQKTDISFQFDVMAHAMNNTDLPGDDNHNFDFQKPFPSEQDMVDQCKAACDATTDCVAWVFVRSGDPANPRCALKGSMPPVNPNTCCVSGVKQHFHESLSVNRTLSGNGSTASQSAPLGQYLTPFVAQTRTLRLFIDHSIIESFADDGEVVIASRVYPDASSKGMALFVRGMDHVNASLSVYQLASAWP